MGGVVTTLALFNNKGGVGKTTLTFHLAYTLAQMQQSVLAVDLDPQANLTAAFLDQEVLLSLWQDRASLPEGVLTGDQASLFPTRLIPQGGGTIGDAVRELERREGPLRLLEPMKIVERLHLVPGDLALSSFEDTLAKEWASTLNGDVGALAVTAAFHRVIQHAAAVANADITLIDVGPNLGAINRAALLAADKVLMPLAADLFSLRGLTNVGPKFRYWRAEWRRRAPEWEADVSANDSPHGLMEPFGYVVMQPRTLSGRPVSAYGPWLEDIPVVFAEKVLNEPRPARLSRPHEIGSVRDYGSLMARAYRANKPGFALSVGDGATAEAVKACEEDFNFLAHAIIDRLDA